MTLEASETWFAENAVPEIGWFPEADETGEQNPFHDEEEADSTSSPDLVPARPRVTSSLVPTPLRGDEANHPVPELVPESHSWLPVSLLDGARSPDPPAIIDLFYPGYNHLLSGESEALKTWLALIAATTELAAGRGVLWVDGDDVGRDALLERLLQLGAKEEAISTGFAYVLPDEPLTEERCADVLGVMRSIDCRLAIFDGFNPLLLLHQLDPNQGTDVELFYRLVDPIRKAGAANLLTDNVVKSPDSRGRWAIGSERKKSKAEVHLGLKALKPLVRGGIGKETIDVHKDPAGHLQRPKAGCLVIESDGERCSWRIDPDESRDEEGQWRPTVYMQRVSQWLELHDGEPSRNEIEKGVDGKAECIRRAIDCLLSEGNAEELPGLRGAKLIRLKRVFRKDGDSE